MTFNNQVRLDSLQGTDSSTISELNQVMEAITVVQLNAVGFKQISKNKYFLPEINEI